MSASFYISMDADKLEKALFELSKRVGEDLGAIIKEEAKYVVKSAVETTPPPSKQAGQRTIANDLNKVAVPLDYQSFEARATEGGFYKSIAKYVRRRNAEKLRLLLQNPNLNLFKNYGVLANQEELASYHQNHRVNGRVRGLARNVAFRADMRRYNKTVSQRVGFMLSGWNKAAHALGVKTKKFAERSYAGSRSNLEYSYGRNPFFVARNGNMKIVDVQKKIDTVVKFRLRIALKKIERAKQKQAINLGFKKLAAGSY
jgi:hypothetical protein